VITSDYGLNVQLLVYRVEEARQQAAEDALCRNLRPVRPSRLSRTGGRLLTRLGRGLLALGQRLEPPARPQPSLTPYSMQAQRRQ
jgi:hypothetical protein